MENGLKNKFLRIWKFFKYLCYALFAWNRESLQWKWFFFSINCRLISGSPLTEIVFSSFSFLQTIALCAFKNQFISKDVPQLLETAFNSKSTNSLYNSCPRFFSTKLGTKWELYGKYQHNKPLPSLENQRLECSTTVKTPTGHLVLDLLRSHVVIMFNTFSWS